MPDWPSSALFFSDGAHNHLASFLSIWLLSFGPLLESELHESRDCSVYWGTWWMRLNEEYLKRSQYQKSETLSGLWIFSETFLCVASVLTSLLCIYFSLRPGYKYLLCVRDFPGSSDGKESACIAEDPGLIPGSGRSPGEGNGYPLQYSGLENSMDREAWQATKSQTLLSN